MEDSRNEESGSPCAVDWCRRFHKFQGKVPVVRLARPAIRVAADWLAVDNELLPILRSG